MSKGLEAVRDHIRQSFLQIHNDGRTREERVAEQQKPVVDAATERLTGAYISAALRSEHIRKQVPHRDHRWLIEVPEESADAVIAQVVRYLDGGRNG